MTLKASTTAITVQNAAGVQKFSSDDKLVYRKHYFSGSVSLGPSTPKVSIALPGAANDFNTLFLVQCKLTYCSGNIGSAMTGSTFDLSSSALLHFTHSTTAVVLTAQDVLSAYIQRIGGSPSNLQAVFNYYNMTKEVSSDGYGTTGMFAQVGEPVSSVSLQYFISEFGWK